MALIDRLFKHMKLIKILIVLLAMAFIVPDCGADARVLERIRAKSSIKAKNQAAKLKLLKQKAKAKRRLKAPKPDIVKEEPKPQAIVSREELDFRNDVAFLPNGDSPFTGRHEAYHDNGKKYIETVYKNGKKEGRIIMWDEYGHKVGELTYVDGKLLE